MKKIFYLIFPILLATADGPDYQFHFVRGLKKGEQLTVYADRNEKSKVVAKLERNAKGFKLLERWPSWSADSAPDPESIKEKDYLTLEEKEHHLKILKGEAHYWCQIQDKKIIGWVNCKYIHGVEVDQNGDGPACAKVVGVAKNDTLALREDYNPNSKKIMDIPYNAQGFEYYYQCVELKKPNEWCRIRYNDKMGWVRSKFIKQMECP
jgi:hypothetical protein